MARSRTTPPLGLSRVQDAGTRQQGQFPVGGPPNLLREVGVLAADLRLLPMVGSSCLLLALIEQRTAAGAVRSSKTLLAAQAVRGDDRAVALDVVLGDVVEQPPATTDQLQQAASGVVVLLVGLQVLVEVVDALGEECDLDLGRAGVGVVLAMLGDDVRLVDIDLLGHT